MAERAYLSIGEVLSLLQAEFPDVTISKIRFLESQGLLDPERTPSGYRKFYDADVDRLRWILRQQRENFLPLKVIKGRLLGEQENGFDDDGEEAVMPTLGAAAVEAPAPPAAPGEPTQTAASGEPTQTAAPSSGAGVPAEVPAKSPPEPPPSSGAAALSPGLSGASFTLEELASAGGLSVQGVKELERAGFITGRPMADVVYYDEECLIVARLVAGFAHFGIEPRHLRIYKNAAERESGLFQQVIVPLLKQRNPDARRRAMDAIGELSELGERLRAAMLRQALKGLTGG